MATATPTTPAMTRAGTVGLIEAVTEAADQRASVPAVDAYAPWCPLCRAPTPGTSASEERGEDSARQPAGAPAGIPKALRHRDGAMAGRFLGLIPESPIPTRMHRFGARLA